MFSFFRKKQLPSQAPRRNYRPQLEAFEDRLVPTAGVLSGFTLVNLASDVPGQYAQYDPDLASGAGIVVDASGQAVFLSNYMVDTIAGDGQSARSAIGGAVYPVGVVDNGTRGFAIRSNGVSAPAEYLFASFTGVIEGYSPLVNSGQAEVAVDQSSQGAGYSTLVIGTDSNGNSFLYAFNFNSRSVDVFDENLQQVSTGPSAFHDPSSRYAYARNMIVADGHVFIAYDLQTGFFGGPYVVDEFDLDGTLVKSIPLPINMFVFPTAFAIAPADFGSAGGDLLVSDSSGNAIQVYSLDTGANLGILADPSGTPIDSEHINSMAFGPDELQGSGDALYFLGEDSLGNGTFGVIEAPPIPKPPAPPSPPASTPPATRPAESMLLRTDSESPPSDFAPHESAPPIVPPTSSNDSAPSVVNEPDVEGPGSYAGYVAPSAKPAPVARANEPSPTVAVIAPDVPPLPPADAAPTVPTTSPSGPDENDQGVPEKNVDPMDVSAETAPRIDKPVEMRPKRRPDLGALPIAVAAGAGSYLARPVVRRRSKSKRKSTARKK